MTYQVVHTPEVAARIAEQIAHLQRERVDVQTIDAWLTGLLDQIASLNEWPHRSPIAQVESAARGIEIRKMNFGDYVVFYRVDDSSQAVEVLSFRHSARLVDGP